MNRYALLATAWLSLLGTGSVTAAEPDPPSSSAPLWAFPASQAPSTSTDRQESQALPGSTVKYSGSELLDRTTAVDWFPADHPPMPPPVRGGRGAAYACGFCHLPEGLGRTENAPLAGLPFPYLQQQVRDMKSGARRLIDPHFGPAERMLTAISQTSDADADAAARYFSALKYTKHVQVIEAQTIPHATADGFVYVFDRTGPSEPLGERIIEGPDDFQGFEKRDPRISFTAYVPVGAIARGASLASGKGAVAQACTTCHGEGLKGGILGPPIAGRYPTGIFRQLYAFQAGHRNGAQAVLMKPIVAGLSEAQMIDLAAYVGSLTP
jgi:cytochrome c553